MANPARSRYCTRCGCELSPDASFCVQCGTIVKAPPASAVHPATTAIPVQPAIVPPPPFPRQAPPVGSAQAKSGLAWGSCCLAFAALGLLLVIGGGVALYWFVFSDEVGGRGGSTGVSTSSGNGETGSGRIDTTSTGRRDNSRTSDGSVERPLPLTFVHEGQVLAEKSVGLEGGRVEAAGRVTIDFPQGALSKTGKIAIREAKDAPGGGAFYFVDCGVPGMLLKRPARMTLAVPPGLPTDRLRMLEEILPGLWADVPGSRFDPATRTVTGEVFHFSGKAVAICGVMGSTLTGIGWYGLGALGVVTAPGAAIGLGGCAILTAGAAVGAGLSDAVEDRWLKMNCGRALRFTGSGENAVTFEVLWDGRDFGDQDRPGTPTSGFTLCMDRNGRVLTMIPGFHTRDDAVDYLQNLDKKRYDAVAQAQFIPEGIARLAVLLDRVQLSMHTLHGGYTKPGYPQSGTLTVLIQPCGRNAAGEPNDGMWDGKFLYVSPPHLVQLVGDLQGRLSDDGQKVLRTLGATLAHEYWHAIHSQLNPKAQTVLGDASSKYMPWLDECMARTYESEIFPVCTGTFESHKWPTVMARLREGMGKIGGGDEAGDIWPLGKYMLHREKYGTPFVLSTALGMTDRGKMLPLFEEFALSLFVRELALPAYDDLNGTDGSVVRVPTGWQALVEKGLTSNLVPEPLKPGRTPMRMEAAALQFRMVPIAKSNLERRFVVRRELFPTPETILALKPTGTSDAGMPRPAKDCWRGNTGGIVLKPDWLTGANERFALPVAFITGNKGVDHANAVLAYYLAPPASVQLTDVDDKTVEIRWPAPPEPGGNLKPHDVWAGYSLFGRDPKSSTPPRHIANLIFADRETEISKGAVFVKQIRADTVAIKLPRFILGSCPQVGLATMDLLMKDDDKTGAPALSPVTWSVSTEKPAFCAVGTGMSLSYKYRVWNTLTQNREGEADTIKYEYQTENATWQGTTFRYSKPIEETTGMPIGTNPLAGIDNNKASGLTSNKVGAEEYALTPDANALNLLTVEFSATVNTPKRAVKNRFVFQNVPRRATVDLGRNAGVICVFWIKGDEMAKHATVYEAGGEGDAPETDPQTRKPVVSRGKSRLTSVNWKDSWVLVTLSSISLKELQARAEKGLIDKQKVEDAFEKQLQPIIERIKSEK